jgi:hypothetical protein
VCVELIRTGVAVSSGEHAAHENVVRDVQIVARRPEEEAGRGIIKPVWHSSASPVGRFCRKQLHEQLHERGREPCFGSFTM